MTCQADSSYLVESAAPPHMDMADHHLIWLLPHMDSQAVSQMSLPLLAPYLLRAPR